MNRASDQSFDELDELTSALWDGKISPNEIERLEKLVLSSPLIRKRYIEQASLHFALGWNRAEPAPSFELEAVEPITIPSGAPSALVRGGANRYSFWQQFAATTAVAAAFYGVFGMLAWSLVPADRPVSTTVKLFRSVERATSSGNRFVKLVRAEDCRWIEPPEGIKLLEELAGGRLSLASGVAELLIDGVSAVLEGPCSVDLRTRREAHLVSGRISARVLEPAHGFTVTTPTARVVDLGTEFGVEVRDSGDTCVQVFEGVVECLPADSTGETADQEPYRLTAGNAICISPKNLKCSAIAFQPDRFAARPSRVVKFTNTRYIERDDRVAAIGSSVLSSSFPAEAAIDGKLKTFSHTAPTDAHPWWQVDLGRTSSIVAIVLLNRDDCCGGRLRDLTVTILGEDGNRIEFVSPPLNPRNASGGGPDDFAKGPPQIVVDVLVTLGRAVPGRFIRVERTLSAPPPENADNRALSLAEVQVFETEQTESTRHGSTEIQSGDNFTPQKR